MEVSDIINYRDNTHVITDYRYDSFGRRIHTAERTKSGMRTIYDGLGFEISMNDILTADLKIFAVVDFYVVRIKDCLMWTTFDR